MAGLVNLPPGGSKQKMPSHSRARRGDSNKPYARELAERLGARLDGEVRFDAGVRAQYSTDASNYRQPPIGVVLPRHADDIVETLALCREYGAPVLARGGGTSLAGQCCNVAVVIDCSKYMRGVLDVDLNGKTARVEPGCILDHLRAHTRPHNLTFAPDPATHDHCTLGGMIGNNSCGVHSVMGGRTDENIVELEVLTYDGARMTVGATSDDDFERIVRRGGRQAEIYQDLKRFRDNYASRIRERFPDIPRRVSGFNLPWLLPENGFHVARSLVGSEGTLAMVLGAKVRLLHDPPFRTLVALGYRDAFEAGDHVPEVLESGPVGLEGIDSVLIDNMYQKRLHREDFELLPEGDGFLLVEFGGDTQEAANERAEELAKKLKKGGNPPHIEIVKTREREDRIWEVRESGLGGTAYVPNQPSTWPGWEDSAVPPEKVGAYLRALRSLLKEYDYNTAALYGHFGQGCIHKRIPFDLTTTPGIEKYRKFVREAAELCLRYDGSFSGEHGDGQARAELLPMMFGEDLVRGFLEYKSIWDPKNKMNPGKVVSAYRMDENLKLGADYRPPEVKTYFAFAEEEGWTGVTNRCVGVGKCRRSDGGTMCPSYMVTLDEQHSTRGRARTLFEMLQGEVITDGWRSKEVHDALELCLSCKGCKSDCPVNVDMATYKAEFLSHYYEGRPRPRHAYAMGLIMYWARVASRIPQIVNLVTQTPGLSNLAKAAGGIAQQRTLPAFAPQTFRDWFRRRASRRTSGPQVILWPDTFNNHFSPRVLQAAVEVLEDAGYQVMAPKQQLCCGRPLYDYGMLNVARRLLGETIDSLQPALRAGTPIIGLEPSCVAVFRDELTGLLSDNEDAKRLSRQVFTLAEFLNQRDYKPPELHRDAIVHAHCHHSAVMGIQAEKDLMTDMGLSFETLDSGCCGMAGSFGYEADKYDVSMKCAERKLFPEIRETSDRTLLIADGFSCRSQVKDGTRREALHLAEVLEMALREGPGGPSGSRPERDYVALEPEPAGRSVTSVLAMAGVAVAGAGLLWMLAKRSSGDGR